MLNSGRQKTAGAALNAARAETRQSVRGFLACAEKRKDQSGAAVWLWEGIKWYYSADVDFIKDLLQELNEDGYYFIRVGESDDDARCAAGSGKTPSTCTSQGALRLGEQRSLRPILAVGADIFPQGGIDRCLIFWMAMLEPFQHISVKAQGYMPFYRAEKLSANSI